MVYEPSILLLDEPLSALDRKLRERMQRDLRALQQKLSITAIFVTHDQEEALILSDRIAVMSDGRIVQMDRPREVYEHPESHFVADFVGRANSFPAAVTSGDGNMVTIRTESGLELQGYSATTRSAGERVNAVIRPEKIATAHAQDDAAGLAADIDEISYVGPITYLTCRLATGDIVVVARQNSEPGGDGVATGQACRLVWPRESLIVI